MAKWSNTPTVDGVLAVSKAKWARTGTTTRVIGGKFCSSNEAVTVTFLRVSCGNFLEV